MEEIHKQLMPILDKYAVKTKCNEWELNTQLKRFGFTIEVLLSTDIEDFKK